MENIYSNPYQTYSYLQTCIIMVAYHSNLPVHKDIDSFIWVPFFTVIARTSLLVQADIYFSLSWPVQTDVFVPPT